MEWPSRKNGFLPPRYLRPDVLVVKLSGYRHSLQAVLRAIVEVAVAGKGLDLSHAAVTAAVGNVLQLLEGNPPADAAASEAFCELLFWPVKSRASVLHELYRVAVTPEAVSSWATEVRQSAALLATIRVKRDKQQELPPQPRRDSADSRERGEAFRLSRIGLGFVFMCRETFLRKRPFSS